jgi:hypothetical protein
MVISDREEMDGKLVDERASARQTDPRDLERVGWGRIVAGAQKKRAGESKSVYHIVRVCQGKYKCFVCREIRMAKGSNAVTC